VPVVRLTEVFRQAAASRIIINAHRINQGAMLDLGAPAGDSDFYFVPAEDPETAVQRILELVKTRIPKAVDLKQIGRELNVRYVLEGSVQRAGNRMRVKALSQPSDIAPNPPGEARRARKLGTTRSRSRSRSPRVYAVDLGRHDEVVLMQSLDLLGL
jgi:exodeoxyribonuclease V alpha subunit